MSGIAAAIEPTGSPDQRAWIAEAMSHLAIGSPDGSHTWYDDQCALGHALLRTGPFDEGDQPLSHEGSVWITADARLDGREDLVRELRGRGRDARTRESDAALVLHAYHAWGEACVEHLAGDFGFVVRDRPAGRLFCARDHFGVSQLYYSKIGTTLLVATSASALLAHPRVEDTVDERAITDFLLFGRYMDQAITAHSAVRRLPPAHALTWVGGRTQVRRYWSMPEPGKLARFPKPGDYVDRFRQLLTEAVADRLGDGPVSTHLSGGLDSPSVAATAHRILTSQGREAQLRAQTHDAANLVSGDSEAHYAGMIADALGISADVVATADYPNRDPTCPSPVSLADPIPYQPTTKESEVGARTASHGRVMLTGLGGDPLLLFDPSYWIDCLARGRPLRLGAIIWENMRLFHRPPRFYLRPAIGYRLWLAFEKPPVLPDWLGGGVSARAPLERRVLEVMAHNKKNIDIRGMAVAPLWSSLFDSTDPGCTGLAVRHRHPFFDLRLVNYALTLPPVPWLPGKHILREAMTGILPEAVTRRPKTPLGADVQALLAARRGIDPRYLELVAGAHDLDGYLDRGHLISRLRTLSGEGERLPTGGPPDFRFIANGLAIAYWFYHRRGRRAATPHQAMAPRAAAAAAG